VRLGRTRIKDTFSQSFSQVYFELPDPGGVAGGDAGEREFAPE